MRFKFSATAALFFSAAAVASQCFASGDVVDVVTDSIVHPCNGCTEPQIESLAAGLGRGNHYVYNLPGNQLHYLNVECEPISGGTQCYASEGTPDSAEISLFTTYHSSWVANGYSEAFTANVQYNFHSAPPAPGARVQDDGYINAFDTVVLTQYEDRVSDDLLDANLYATFLANLVRALTNSPVPDFANFTLTVNVTFHDTSKRTFTFNKVLVKMAPIGGTARDSDGNSIPETPPNGGHQFIFGGPNYQPYNLPNLTTIIPNAAPQPAAPAYCITEVFDAKTGTDTCTVVHN